MLKKLTRLKSQGLNVCIGGVKAVHGRLGTARITAWFMRRTAISFFNHGHNYAGYTPLITQCALSLRSLISQFFARVNRLNSGFVHTIHRPYGNYYYVYK